MSMPTSAFGRVFGGASPYYCCVSLVECLPTQLQEVLIAALERLAYDAAVFHPVQGKGFLNE
jgi:hypothetical protein